MRSPRRSQASWWRLLAILLLLLLCALCEPEILHGQTPSPQEPPTLTQLLQIAAGNLAMLSDRLLQRQQQVADLRVSLQQAESRRDDLAQSLAKSETYSAALEAQLTRAQESVASLQRDLTATSSSLALLQMQYESVSQGWQQYRELMRGQVKSLERARWLWGVGGVVVGIIVGGGAVLLLK